MLQCIAFQMINSKTKQKRRYNKLNRQHKVNQSSQSQIKEQSQRDDLQRQQSFLNMSINF